MKYDARFSVVLPLSSLDSNRLDSFEEMCQRYKLAVDLPISLNQRGDLYIVSSGLSLRDAQMLRRQIAGIGFPADVIADEVNGEEKVTTSSLNTLVVGSDVFEANRPEDVGDIMSSAWENLEIPATEDVNLDDLVTRTPEMLVEEETANNSTKGVSFMELMKAARGSEEPAHQEDDFGFHALDGGFLLDSPAHADKKDKKDPADIFAFLDDDLPGHNRHQETLDLIQKRLTPETPLATTPVSSTLNHAISSAANKKVDAYEVDDEEDDDVTIVRAVPDHLVAHSGQHAGLLDDLEIDIDLSEINDKKEGAKPSESGSSKSTEVANKIALSAENAKKEETKEVEKETKPTEHVEEKHDAAPATDTEKTAEPEAAAAEETPAASDKQDTPSSEHKEAQTEATPELDASASSESASSESSAEDKKTPESKESVHAPEPDKTEAAKQKEPVSSAKDKTEKEHKGIDRSKFEAQNDSIVQKNEMDALRRVHIALLVAAAFLVVLTLIHIFVMPLSVISALTISN